MFNGSVVDSHAYTYDDLSRPTGRTSGGIASSFAYNDRSEVVSAQIGTNLFAHAYDYIGNQTLYAANAETNAYTHNALNQIETATVPQFSIFNSPFSIFHDLDGNLTNGSVFAYSYDAANRLASVSSNGVVLVANEYDYRGRRIRKTTPTAETTFVYDGWNLIHETVATISGGVTNTTEIQYFWGADLSETLQGAGGVGGLLAVSLNNNFYFPAYDNNGNITKYIDESGNVVAAYEYDAFGRIVTQSGSLADFFRHRFSTKYFDVETGLYYYGYRFYSPSLMRWLNRDPIEERGGLNLYAFCNNAMLCKFDVLGRSTCCRKGKETPCDKFYKWKGNVTTSSLTWGLGATFLMIDLKSNFVCMTCSSWRIHIKAVLLTAAIGIPFSLTGSNVEFGNVSPDAFVGSVSLIGAGVGAMGVVEASSLRIGNAWVNSIGLVGGAELGAGGAYGWFVDFEMVEE